MPFKAAKCSSCGGALQVPDDKDTIKCMYCGVDVIVHQVIQLAAGTIKKFTNTTPIIKAKGGVISALVALLFGSLLLFTGVAGGIVIGLGLLAWGAFRISRSTDEITIGFKGECPYCDSHLAILYEAIASPLVNKFSPLAPSIDAKGEKLGLTCKVCQNRIIFQDNKFFSISTAVSGVRKTD